MSQVSELNIDTLIIGAGVIGSSVAMSLAAKQPGAKIRVIDFDLEGSLSSSELNAGGVRATWNQPINIQMSKLTIDYLAKNAEAVGYRDCGYLWLYRSDKLPFALKARELQLQMGWNVEAWDVAELRRKVSLIDKTDDLAGAVFAPKDGLVNPNLLKNHFRELAKKRGVVFDDRTLLRAAEHGAESSILKCERFSSVLSHEQKVAALTGGGNTEPAAVTYHARQVVNCAGAWAAGVAEILGYRSPSYSQRRQICIFDCRDVDLTPYGMMIDPSGVYFHPEATNGLAGYANHDEPSSQSFTYDGEDFFMEHIWPALHERATAFERLKHLTGWAGLYEVSPDESAIIGEAHGVKALHKISRRVYEAHSFSGHGVMHSYSAGVSLAELMVDGKYSSLDVSSLSGSRFHEGREVRESLVI